MTNDQNLIARDYRRAAVIIAHFGRQNLDGVTAILEEANDDRRVLALIVAVLGLYNKLVPELRTPLGMKIMSSEIYRLTGLEAEETGQ